jgi:hypothetical protein
MANKELSAGFITGMKDGKIRLCCFVLFLLLCLLTGCAAQRSSVPMNYRWANVDGSQLNEPQAGEQFYFNILVDDGLIAEGTPVKIIVNGQVNSGSLRFELRAPDGQAVWNSGTIGAGDFSMNTEYALPAGQTGTYTLGLVYGTNTTATYNLSWNALKLGPAILLPGAGMILVALAFVVYAANRKILNWRYLGLGAAFWVLTVAVKFAFAIPVNSVVFRLLGVTYEKLFSPGNLLAYLYESPAGARLPGGRRWFLVLALAPSKHSYWASPALDLLWQAFWLLPPYPFPRWEVWPTTVHSS